MAQEIAITPHLAPEQLPVLTRWISELDHALENPRQAPQPIAQSGLLERIGTMLWTAAGLNAEDMRSAIEQAREDEDVVRFVVTAATDPRWPWELLYHPHPELGFLGRHPFCVVVRRSRGDGTKSPKLKARPLRVLLFISSPEDLDPTRGRLDFEKEEELLFTALDGPLSRGELVIDVAEDGCLRTLLARLEQHYYHAVIMSMHGMSAPTANGEREWGLLFEDPQTGQSTPIASTVLTSAFDRLPRGHRPGLLVLSACRSATAEESADSITSVAQRLHESGIARVLGMRLSVLDAAAAAFTAELFRRVALGETVGRAVTCARAKVAQGEWLHEQDSSGRGAPAPGDRFAQWTLPVLFDRTADGPLVDVTVAAEEVIQRPSSPSVLIGDGTIRVPRRGTFVGRRSFIRQYLRPFLDGNSPRLLFTGPGGVGKTTLAGLFARTLQEKQPRMRVLGFQAPFDLSALYEPLRHHAFDGDEEPTLLRHIQMEPDLRQRIARLLQSLARRQPPCAFVLDNLESLQDLATLDMATGHGDSLWLLRTVCALPPPTRVLLTGRYPLSALPGDIQVCPVPDAPFGDVLAKMNRLRWPQPLAAHEKREIYQVLGGNHRALEWTAQVLAQQQTPTHELVTALRQLQAPPTTPRQAVAAVLEAMRENLLFAHLRDHLSPAQDRLLRTACLLRVPVNEDGLLAIESQPEHHDANRSRLVAYALLEHANDPRVNLDYFIVPPVVKELVGDLKFNATELQELHRALGQYHRFQGEHLSRRVRDYVEAIRHFRQAGAHHAADALAETVCGFYYRRSNYADASALSAEIVTRDAPPPPWWALNRYGQCQLKLGFSNEALAAFTHALRVAPTRKAEGATLNNLSQIYQARGTTTPRRAIRSRVCAFAVRLATRPGKVPPSIISVKSMMRAGMTTTSRSTI
jgi:tetratricopeptide (TPR) repeat protein